MGAPPRPALQGPDQGVILGGVIGLAAEEIAGFVR